MHVHLKDVLAPGGHITCRFGRGCVPVAECVQALAETGYGGPIGVEHEPDDFDPTADCIENLRMVRCLLGAST